MLIQACEEDPVVSDFLDNIIINQALVANSGYSNQQTYSGSRVSIDMSFRVDCAQDFYGADCSVHCIAQDDDVNGHFTCDPEDGSRICKEGFEDPETFCRESEA